MEQDIPLMLCQEFLRIPGLPLGHIDLTGLGVVDDMFPQGVQLRHPRICRLDLAGQLMEPGRNLVCLFAERPIV